MGEPSTSNDKDWVKCKSKSRPNHYYFFNRKTGASRWTSDSSDINTQTTILAEPSISKTPAQDRLKRLQKNLELNKLKESGIVKAKDSRQCRKLNFPSEKEKQNAIKELSAIGQESLSNRAASSTSKTKSPKGKPSTSKETSKNSDVQKRLDNYATNITTRPKAIPSGKGKFRIPKKPTSQTENTSYQKKTTHQSANEDVSSSIPSPVQSKKRPLLASADMKKDLTDASSPKKTRTTEDIKTKLINMPSGIKMEKTIQCDVNSNVKSSIVNDDGEKPGLITAIKDFCTNLFKKVGQNYKGKPPEDTKKHSNLLHYSKPSFKRKKLECNKIELKGALLENQSRRSEARIPYSSTTTSPTTSFPGSANDRLQRLRKSLQVQQISSKPSLFLSPASPETSTSSIPYSPSVSVLESEPMDWQPISEEYFKDVTHAALDGTSICSTDLSTSSEHYETVNENLLRLAANKKQEKHWKTDYFYFVVDTNVFLENITFVDELTTMTLCETAGTIIYVPYCVLQELDKLKIRSPSESIKIRSSRAIKYLNNAFEKKAQYIQAQSAADEHNHLVKVSSPDDSILNCCLQVKKHIDNVLLLTEDINLRNKAISSDVLVSTKSDLISKHESQI